MEIVIDVSEKELMKFGKEFLKKKIKDYIEIMNIEEKLKEISYNLKKEFNEDEYWSLTEKIRESSWEEFKKTLDFDIESSN